MGENYRLKDRQCPLCGLSMNYGSVADTDLQETFMALICGNHNPVVSILPEYERKAFDLTAFLNLYKSLDGKTIKKTSWFRTMKRKYSVA